MSKLYYITYRLEDDSTSFHDTKLERGYYKYAYDLSGSADIEKPCEFSSDRAEWTKCGLFKNYSEFIEFFEGLPGNLMKFEREDYAETLVYRGFSIPLFCDDYGQCFYCIFDNKCISFGTYNTEYEESVKYLVDHAIEKREKSGSNE